MYILFNILKGNRRKPKYSYLSKIYISPNFFFSVVLQEDMHGRSISRVELQSFRRDKATITSLVPVRVSGSYQVEVVIYIYIYIYIYICILIILCR